MLQKHFFCENVLVKIYFNKRMSVVTFRILNCDILPVVLSFFKTFMGFSHPAEQLKQTVEANISCQKLDSVFMSKLQYQIYQMPRTTEEFMES